MITVCPWADCGRRLEGLGRFCHSCLRYPEDFRPESPDAAPVNRDDPRSEAEIQHAIKNALRAMGFSCWDTSQPHAAKITPGLPDLFAVGRGLTCWIEVKSAKGKQTPEQERFQAAVEANSGLYLLARHESQVIEFLTGAAAR